jgi:hypothetical protein
MPDRRARFERVLLAGAPDGRKDAGIGLDWLADARVVEAADARVEGAAEAATCASLTSLHARARVWMG